MTYDRYDAPNAPRDERSRWQDERNQRGEWGDRDRDERGFFERAGDEIASWFGDDEAERRRREDQMRDERESRWSGSRDEGRSDYRGRSFVGDRGSDRDRERERGWR